VKFEIDLSFPSREGGRLPSLRFGNKTYEIDDQGFLLRPDQWDEDFAEGMAPKVDIKNGLTASHWRVLRFIRDTYSQSGTCPMVHETCKALGLITLDLSILFPTGYLRGACKLAGLTYRTQDVQPSWLPKERLSRVSTPMDDRVYRVTLWGYLVDPSEWDEDFAVHKSREMKMPGPLTEKHWQIIRFLRKKHEQTGRVPTVYEVCSAVQIEIDELGRLFPDGYHRGVVKLAGLRVL
jgi:tRNA 2-thiouridine synthesizing protein E